ncbi:MAG: dihydroorotase [Gammaproteobacteria bacterium]
MKTIIQSGHAFLPNIAWDQKTNVSVEDEAIAISTDRSGAGEIINAAGCWILPGITDLHAYLSPPNQLFPVKAIEQELNAAFQRGITQVVIPPNIQLPSVNGSTQVYKVGPLSHMLDGETLSDLNALAESGCIGFSMGRRPVKDLNTLRNFYRYAASFNFKILIEPFEVSLSEGGFIHEGQISDRTGLKGIPALAETISIAQHLLLIEDTGVNAHFSGITCARSVELIADGKKNGLPITADTIMSHLHLTEIDCADFNPHCHVYPPLRSETDKRALIKGLEEGTIDAIASYHVPLTSEHKSAPFSESTPGMSGFDTLLSLGLHLVNRKTLSLKTLIHALSTGPQKALNLPASKQVIILDPNAEWLVSGETFLSKGHNSPFKGLSLPGRVVHIV